MRVERGPAIIGLGVGVPPNIVRNDDLRARGLETDDQWIRTRTGIRERRYASAQEAASDLGTIAAREAMEMADINIEDINDIVVATSTPDAPMPATASFIHKNLGAPIRTSAMDLGAACAGSIYGLRTMYALHMAKMAQRSLFIGAEVMSRIVDQNDRSTAVLFGDGAGAVVIQTVNDPGITRFLLRNDSEGTELLCVPGGGSREPTTQHTVSMGMHSLRMNGNLVYENAIKRMVEVSVEIMNGAGFEDAHGNLRPQDIDLVLPHQANQRILNVVADKLGIPRHKMFCNIDRYGNTSAASVYIAMKEAYDKGRLHPGNTLLIVAFGAGFAWGAGVLQWHIEAPKKTLRERIWPK